MMNMPFYRDAGGAVCAAPSVTADDVETLVTGYRNAGKDEVTVRIPAAALPLFEMKRFCADGVCYRSAEGAECFTVHRSLIFDGCERLCFDRDTDAVMTRTVFRAGEAAQAKLYITALGYFEPYLNGRALTEDRLIPPMSDYEQRELSGLSYPIYDKMSHRVYYYVYDVRSFLTGGDNVLSAHIGNGWYGDNRNPAEGVPKWGDKYLLFRLVLTDHAGVTKELRSSAANTRWRPSHILQSSLYYGEYHDYTRYVKGWNEPNAGEADWRVPAAAGQPLTFYMKADFPADRDCGEIAPRLIRRTGDRKLYDLGEIAAGVPVIVGDADAGENTMAVLRYADRIEADGSLDFDPTGGAWRGQRDVFVFSKEFAETELRPRFLWHASRYIELTGTAALKRFVKVQTPLKRISRFHCSNETLNWLFEAFCRTEEANVHGSVPSDCPHRERLGYTGDGQLTAGAVMSVYDAREMYRKWMRDIRDCQDIRSGHVQHTAPFYGGGGGPGGWGGAAVIVPYRYYQFYGDINALKDAWSSMQGYMRYMASRCENGLVVREEEKGWCLGDWCAPGKVLLPEPFVNTWFYIKCADICRETAEILGYEAVARDYARLAAEERAVFTKRFFDESTGSFLNGVQAADEFAVDIGLGDSRTIGLLAARYRELGTFDTGIFGTDVLIRVLFREGYADLACKLLTNEGEASFFNMKKQGAMNLWENWNGEASLCHPMFGAVTEYLFSEILGIRRYQDRPGYRDVTIRPANLPALKNVSGTLGTPWGNITVVIRTDETGARKVSYLTDPGITVHAV